ncbi:efflux RND transporter permease subunit, partial [Rickettsiales bacterium]|nr:efflux RND transporter permease subunit [Rickettsiales bacterium]
MGKTPKNGTSNYIYDMENITKFAIKYNRVTALVLICGILLGTAALFNMPRQEDPTVTIRSAQINTYFQGMSTELMENLIAAPIERKLREIPEIKDINTTVRTGHVLIQPNLYDRYFDLEPIWQKLRNKMDEIQSELPAGTQGPFVNDDFGRVAVATVALYSKDFPTNEIYNLAEQIQDQLYGIEGLSKIEIYGKQDEQIYLEFNIATLSNYGLKPNNIIQALQNQNIVSSSGSIEANGRTLQLEVSGRFTNISEIENLTITNPNNNLPLYLRDIVTIERKLIEPPTKPVFYKNQPAIILSFSMIEQFNIEEFGKVLTQKINQVAKTLPAGLQIDFATYQPDLVKKSVEETINNLFQTVCVVLLVVICFLGLRNGLIVGLIIPMTIMLTLIIMEMVAIDLQNMSIAAIIIALGLLVDDGIIITEDIATRSESEKSIEQASLKTVSSLAIPSLISSLTTMLAFLPLAMSENVTGEYLSPLSYVIVIALFISWFLSIYAVPLLCVTFLKQDSKSDSQKLVDKITEKFKAKYKILLNYILKKPFLFIITMIILLVAALYCIKFIPKQMLPYSDRNQFLIYLDLPAGTNINETKETAIKLGDWLNDTEINPEIKSHITYIGFGGPRFVLSLSPPNPQDNVAFFIINTKTNKEIPQLIKRAQNYMSNNLPNANGRAKQMWMGGQEIGLIEYRVKGPDDKTLYEIASKIEKII